MRPERPQGECSHGSPSSKSDTGCAKSFTIDTIRFALKDGLFLQKIDKFAQVSMGQGEVVGGHALLSLHPLNSDGYPAPQGLLTASAKLY